MRAPQAPASKLWRMPSPWPRTLQASMQPQERAQLELQLACLLFPCLWDAVQPPSQTAQACPHKSPRLTQNLMGQLPCVWNITCGFMGSSTSAPEASPACHLATWVMPCSLACTKLKCLTAIPSPSSL